MEFLGAILTNLLTINYKDMIYVEELGTLSNLVTIWTVMIYYLSVVTYVIEVLICIYSLEL